MVRYGLKICTWQTYVGRTSGHGDPYRIIISSMYNANYANPHQKTWTESQVNTLSSYYYFNEPKNWSEDYPIDENYLKIIKR